MRLSDVSVKSFAFKSDRARKRLNAYEMPRGSRVRIEVENIADQAARDEMMQEIHTMLCHLCGISEEDGG